MRKAILAVSTAALLTVGVSSTARADAVSDCAKIQGKALGVLVKGLIKEGVRACGKGFAMAPRLISRKAVGSMTGKFLVGIGKGIDEFGPGGCGLEFTQLDQGNVFNSAQGLANEACLVP